jgi:hypothetical protein
MNSVAFLGETEPEGIVAAACADSGPIPTLESFPCHPEESRSHRDDEGSLRWLIPKMREFFAESALSEANGLRMTLSERFSASP